MKRRRDSNSGDGFGFSFLVIVVSFMAVAFVFGLRNDSSPVGHEVERVRIGPLRDGHRQIALSSLICFGRSDGKISWRKNVLSYASSYDLPSIDDEQELVAGFGDAGGERTVYFFRQEGDHLVVTEDYIPKGNIVGAIDQFLSGGP